MLRRVATASPVVHSSGDTARLESNRGLVETWVVNDDITFHVSFCWQVAAAAILSGWEPADGDVRADTEEKSPALCFARSMSGSLASGE